MCGQAAHLLVRAGVLVLLGVSLPQSSAWCPGSPKLASFFALAGLLKNWCTDMASEAPPPDLGMPPFLQREQEAAPLMQWLQP